MAGILDSPNKRYLEIETINSKIIDKEIELFKLNTYFRFQNGKDRPGKRLRIMAYQNINYFCTFSGLLVNVIYNFVYYDKLRVSKPGPVLPGEILHIPTIIQLGATVPRFVGKAILISGTAFEAALEAYDKNGERKRGFDIKTVDAKVLQIKKDIDTLMAKRNIILSQAYDLSNKQKEIANLDTKLMSESQDLACIEYVRLHSRSVYRSMYNRSENTLTLIKKSDGDFGSDLVRIIAAFTHNDILNPVSSTSTTISGSMSALNPFVELAFAGLNKHFSQINIAKKLDQTQMNLIDKFKTNQTNYDTVVSKISEDKEPYLYKYANVRNELYRQVANVYSDMSYIDGIENKSQKHHQIHSVVMHQIYGWSKASRGMWLIYVGWHYINQPRENALLTGQAGIINLSGAAIRLADTFRTDFLEYKDRTKNAAKKSVVGTILNARLNNLEGMETTNNNQNSSSQSTSSTTQTQPSQATSSAPVPDSGRISPNSIINQSTTTTSDDSALTPKLKALPIPELYDYAVKRNVCLMTNMQLLEIFRNLTLSQGNIDTIKKNILETSGWLQGFDNN